MTSDSIQQRLERAQNEAISHEVIGTNPIQVRIENETPNSRSDRSTHLVVVGGDWITSSSPDFLYRGLSDSASSSKEHSDAGGSDGVRESNTVRFPDKYMLYLATQDEDLLLRDRVRSVLDVELYGIAEGVQHSDETDGGVGTTDDAETRFRSFIDTIVNN